MHNIILGCLVELREDTLSGAPKNGTRTIPQTDVKRAQRKRVLESQVVSCKSRPSPNMRTTAHKK